MCARYTLRVGAQTIVDLFDLEALAIEIDPRFNVAPTDVMPIVRINSKGQRVGEGMRWGLVPSWAKSLSEGVRMINARSETAFEKPAFRQAIVKRRCLVPVDGFYEWQERPNPDPTAKKPTYKQPLHFTVEGADLFAFAGLYEFWVDRATGERTATYTVLTCAPNELVAPIHDRMPVILPPEAYASWLDPKLDQVDAIAAMMQPFPADRMSMREADLRVGNPRFDDPTVLQV